jgi:hypothetical protein
VGAYAPGESGIPALITTLQASGGFETIATPLDQMEKNIAGLHVSTLLWFLRSQENYLPIIKTKIRSMNLVVKRNIGINDVVIGPLLPEHVRIIYTIDDTYTLREIAQLLHMDDLSVCRYVSELIDMGLVMVDEAPHTY